MKHFFVSGILDLNLNKIHIVLVPKIPNPARLEQFHPISLYNFAYKIISKILANRLKVRLPYLISKEQSTFINGRQIQHNILIIHEVFHQLRISDRKARFQVVLKLEMQKAYDRVEWNFLEECFLKMGFCMRWVQF